MPEASLLNVGKVILNFAVCAVVRSFVSWYSYESYISNIPTDMLYDIDQSLYQNYFCQN